MKNVLKNVLIGAAALAVLAGSGCLYAVASTYFGGKHVKGSGTLMTRTLPAPDFSGIDVSRGIRTVISDQVSDIRIEADDNLAGFVIVKAYKDELDITLDKKINSISNAHITVTVPANGRIRSLEASSASKIVSEVALKADKFSLDASSAASIEATVESVACEIEASSASKIKASVTAQNCTIDASSSAKIDVALTADDCKVEASSASSITLEGTVRNLAADLSSASKLHASKLTAQNAALDASSAAGASVNCTEKLTASASSGSSIRYTGECQVSLSKSSGGSIHKK